MRLLPLLLLLLSCLSFSLHARIYSVPALAEANDYVDTNPQEAIRLTQKYVHQARRQSMDENREPFRSSDDRDLTLRSPVNVIQAMHIKARAESNLERSYAALNTLEQALILAQQYELLMAGIETELLQAQVHWQALSDHDTAMNLLNRVDAALSIPQNRALISIQRQLNFRSTLLRGHIQSELYNEDQAVQLLTKAQSYLEHLDDDSDKIDYYLTMGRHYLKYKHENLALDQLIAGFWLASDTEIIAKLADANLLLAQLYERRQIFDKALQHASAAGDFYESHQRQKQLSQTLTLIASIYEQQMRFNLALVHYFNALDLEKQLSKHSRSSQLRLNVARVYWQLYNYVQSEKYLMDAKRIAKQNGNDNVTAQVEIMFGELFIAQSRYPLAIEHLQRGLALAGRVGNLTMQMDGERLLSRAYQEDKDFYEALMAQRRFEQLQQTQQQTRDKNEIEVFKGRQRMLERNIKLEDMERMQLEQKLVLYRNERIILGLTIALVLIFLYARNRTKKRDELHMQLLDLRRDFYKHPRSGLKNLRMLNARLPSSLQRTSANFEQWHLGEIINEPLSDRLRFALIDVPVLRQVYVEKGYQQGLKFEREFGDYLLREIFEPARIYHFSDGIFLYLEPNARMSSNPDQLSDSLNTLINRFMESQSVESVTRMGLAEYPFLPRAYTAINDQELIDILLMAMDAAKKLSKNSNKSEWVHLRAIEAAPAASFVNKPIREACQQGLQNGLLRVLTSSESEVSW
ncbi:tetratricopeptide repeat protein [Thaumasiovibrio subtropicus]|uniref:tetratricopeptide repeat protein n=1 Tax=Thaumasiovibrio subtropicus TaxID=1891207 RepID=UPI000B3572D3|nr:tetratricopeptide repeat protein [Thaumasiovibrio subtropicus]